MRKKGYALFLTAAMILAMGISVTKVNATELPETERKQMEMIMPRYEEINDIQMMFNISGTTANMQLKVICPSSKTVSIKMILQRKDGSSWIRVQKWTKEGKGTQILKKSMTVTKGKKYRVKYTIKVGSETVTGKTAVKTA